MNSSTAVEVSENSKTGPVSATYASQASCPKDCKFLKKGCYAEQSFAGFTTHRLNRSPEKRPDRLARKEAQAIASLTGKLPLRLHVVGDARTKKAAEILAAAARAYTKKHGQKVWAYTHAWRKVARRSWRGVSILASVERREDIAKAAARGYAAALVVDSFEGLPIRDEAGNRLLPCPAQGAAAVQCVDCRLCWKDDHLLKHKIAIVFKSHGTLKASVNRILRGSKDAG